MHAGQKPASIAGRCAKYLVGDMFSSLRFRLPALFLLGIVVSGLIAALVALRLFQGYVLTRSKADLRREAIGLTEVFAQQAITANDTGVLPRIGRWGIRRVRVVEVHP